MQLTLRWLACRWSGMNACCEWSIGVLAEQLLFGVGLLAGGNAQWGSCRVPKAVEKW